MIIKPKIIMEIEINMKLKLITIIKMKPQI